MPPAGGGGHRPVRQWLVAAALAGWGLLAGCERPSAPPPAEITDNQPSASLAAASAADPDPAATAVRTVAGFLAVAPDRVRVIEVTAEVFPDASLGCPEPDMLYAQVLTPGWTVLAEAEGRRFDVRVAGDSGRICHRKSLPAPGPRDADTAVERAARLARDELAQSTGASADAVRLLGWWPVPAGTAVPGCAIDCPAGAADCGVLLELELDDRRYRYHVGNGSARPCVEISPD